MSEEPNSDERPQPAEPRTTGPRRTGLRRLLIIWRVLLGTALLGVAMAAGVLFAGYLLVEIPAPNSAAAAQNNVYLYSDGSPLARDGEINRQKVELSDVPARVRHAVLAAEDRDFYHQSAIDPKAMIRAGWNMLRGEGKQSGSTITQQYVKNYYLGQEQTLTRKAKEFFIALKLDRETSKDEILAGYLNTSYFGRNAYGIQAAAQAYYAKDAGDLTTAEGAYLAALLNSPNLYDVGVHPQNRNRALARWNYVLNGMTEEGWLKPADRDAMTFPKPQPAKPPTGLSGQRGYLVEAVNKHLADNDIISERQLARGGYRITTTIDRDKQDALVEAVEEELLSQLSPDRQVDSYVRAGGTSIDPHTGEVVAMYGGIGYTRQYVNNATRRDYQAGSTFKPLVYASALENDARTRDGETIGPNTLYDGTNGRTVIGPDGPTTWKPENEDGVSYDEIPVSTAMDKSVNVVFAQMGVDIGPEKIKSTAVRLGLPQDTPGMTDAQGSVALGTATPSTLDLAQAYATLANHGKRINHTLVKEITRDGERVRLPRPNAEQAVSRATADATTAVLRGVIESGTGTAAQTAGRPAAGKTGTAEEDRAAWFAGYTPDLATVIAVMGQDPRSGVHKPLYGAAGMPRINGGGFPARIWGTYTAAALRDTPARDFDLKPGGKDRLPSASASPDSTDSPDEPDEPESVDLPDDSDYPDPPENPGHDDPGHDVPGHLDDGAPPDDEAPVTGPTATTPPGLDDLTDPRSYRGSESGSEGRNDGGGKNGDKKDAMRHKARNGGDRGDTDRPGPLDDDWPLGDPHLSDRPDPSDGADHPARRDTDDSHEPEDAPDDEADGNPAPSGPGTPDASG